jgi:hypothetical protein
VEVEVVGMVGTERGITMRASSTPAQHERVGPREEMSSLTEASATIGEVERPLVVYQKRVEVSIMVVVEGFVAEVVAEEAADMASRAMEKIVALESMTEEAALDEGMLLLLFLTSIFLLLYLEKMFCFSLSASVFAASLWKKVFLADLIPLNL